MRSTPARPDPRAAVAPATPSGAPPGARAGSRAGPLLAIEGLSVDFPGASGTTRAVDGVSFAIPSGRKFALVGESGSGKTVTALAVLRLLDGARMDGRIAFDGRDLAALSEREMRAVRGRDIAMVFQEPMTALNPLIPIGVQICESLEIHEGLARAQARVRAVELLERTGIPEPERRFASYPFQLSGGQRQRAMIAVALACRPRLLIADEPTTALDVSLRRQIVELLDDLVRESGMSALLITHDLNLVRAFADQVGVMQKGRIVEQADTAELFARPVHPYTQRLLDSQPRRMVESLPADAPVLLEARDVRCRFFFRKGWFGRRAFDAVHDASIKLRRGETLGVVGESGSGKTTLGMALLRLSPASVDGDVRFDGIDLRTLGAEALRRLRRRMQVVFQDPYSSLSPRRTVGQIVEEGLELHRPGLLAAQRRDEAAAALEEVGLSGAMMQRYPHEFSGGQRQRIAIARALVVRPDLLLLDEPTSALDVSVQKQVLELLAQLQRRHGLAYLFITHDLAVIRAMAHRLVVMQGGRVVEAGDTESVFASPSHDYTRRLLGATF